MNEIGEKLKEARQAKGYTLDDLQQSTKIQKRYLLAIEEGNLDVLPGNFYARAFIKQYADTVGLNGDQLLSEHTDYIPDPQNKNYAEKVASKQTRSGNKKGNILGDFQNYLPTILVVILVMAIGGAIYYAISRTNINPGSFISTPEDSSRVEISTSEASQNSADSSSTEDTSEEDTTAKEEQSLELVSSSGSETVYTVVGNAAEHVLILQAEGGETWVSITVDGVTVDQDLIQSGSTLESQLPESAKSVVLVIGNSSVTSIQLNGEDVPYAEEASGAVRQEITLQFE